MKLTAEDLLSSAQAGDFVKLAGAVKMSLQSEKDEALKSAAILGNLNAVAALLAIGADPTVVSGADLRAADNVKRAIGGNADHEKVALLLLHFRQRAQTGD